MMQSRQNFAERKLLALLDAWDKATNQADPKWRAAWAAAEIEAGLPCIETIPLEDGTWTQVNAGPVGWRRWLAA